jgi:hypothetical protein
VGLFGKDPSEPGIRTTATIERVTVTATDNGGEHDTGTKQEVFLTFRFTDEHGTVALQERRMMVGKGAFPPPGSTVDITYQPGRPRSLDYAHMSVRPPDPDVPRGWSAGIFEVEDLGGHRARSPFARRGIDDQRELFRSGQRAQAEVLGVKRGTWEKRGVHQYTFRLRAGDRELEAKAWTPALCVPKPGDVIEIATNGDRVALDSDERYDGPPGQALVFTTPPGVAEQRSQQAASQFAGWTSASVSQAMTNAQRAFGMNVGPVPAPPAPPAADPLDRLAKLGKLRASGAITEEEFAALKAELLAD